MTTPKASGPLWAWANGEGGIDYEDVRKREAARIVEDCLVAYDRYLDSQLGWSKLKGL
jgi:hypothetical protein